MAENNEFEKKTTSIHTLESDLASAVRDENYGKNIIKIVTNPDNNSLTQNKKVSSRGFDIGKIVNKRNILILSLLIILAGAGGTMLYILNQAKNVTVEDLDALPTSTTTDSLVNTPIIKNSDVLNPEVIQSSDFSNLNRFEIIAEINKIKGLLTEKQIEANNNVGINTNLTPEQFFQKIRYSGDESFLRALDNEYAFGLYSLKNNKFETYLLIKISNFDLAFKSILDWEKYMSVDLKDIFIGNNEANTMQNASSSNATSTGISYSKKNTTVFVDRILKNYDIREFVKNEDNTTIIYGFINNKYLLITSGESSFVDIKDRLLRENISR